MVSLRNLELRRCFCGAGAIAGRAFCNLRRRVKPRQARRRKPRARRKIGFAEHHARCCVAIDVVRQKNVGQLPARLRMLCAKFVAEPARDFRKSTIPAKPFARAVAALRPILRSIRAASPASCR